jgi:hypothetical protein
MDELLHAFHPSQQMTKLQEQRRFQQGHLQRLVRPNQLMFDLVQQRFLDSYEVVNLLLTEQ